MERERERESIHFLCEQNMDGMEEKITIFYSKKMRRKKVKIKGRWMDKEIVRLRKYYSEWTTNEHMLMLLYLFIYFEKQHMLMLDVEYLV